MKRERMMAIFIGSLMIMSLVSFGLSSTRFSNPASTISVPFIVERQLASDEMISILSSGKIIIEDTYSPECSECVENNMALTTFFGRFRDYAVIQMIEGNETSVKIIGSGGRIKDISGIGFTDGELMDAFCEMAIAQPRECLLDQI